MRSFNSPDELRDFMLSQPFDKKLSNYKSSLYPEDKLLYDKEVGPYYNYILDWQTGKYEYMSNGLKELLGYDDEFFERGIEATFEIMHPSDREAVHKMISRFLELLSGKPEEEFNRYSINYNFRVKKSNGAYVNLLQQSVYTTMDHKGNYVYDAGIVMDITRYRTDGNLSLIVVGPEGQQVLEYYPKEEFAPRIATVRETFSELDQLAGQEGGAFLRDVQKVLQHHGKQEKLNVEKFSRQLKISRSHCYRKIKKTFGVTPNRLIRLYRLQQSLEHLARNKLQISEVAYRVGFHSPSYFSQCFHNEFECTPSQYQERVR